MEGESSTMTSFARVADGPDMAWAEPRLKKFTWGRTPHPFGLAGTSVAGEADDT